MTARIGIDVHNLTVFGLAGVRTGIQEVSWHLACAIERLQHRPTEHEYVPVLVEYGDRTFEAQARPARALPAELARGSITSFEELATLDWLVLTGATEFSRLARALRELTGRPRLAVLCHDLIPLLAPELAAEGIADWFARSYGPSIRDHAEIVLANSRHTALDVERWLAEQGVSERPVYPTTLPPICFERLAPGVRASSEVHGLEEGRYFVHVGTLEPRKGIGTLIAGFLRFQTLYCRTGDGFRLVLIGRRGWGMRWAELERVLAACSGSVLELGYVERARLEQLVLGARAVCLVSSYEGFGFPIAVAHAMGIPTISCANSSLPEASGYDGLYVHPGSIDELALAMMRVASARFAPRNATDVNDAIEATERRWEELVVSWGKILTEAATKETRR